MSDLRYSRQVVLPEIGSEGQTRLRDSHVVIVGAGGLGCPAALYLAGAGVGRLTIVDPDRVEESNLHRQLLYGPGDLGSWKAEAAATALQRQNPDIVVVPVADRLRGDNAVELLQGADVVVDGTDTFLTRYAINDACVDLGIPVAFASVHQLSGQASLFAVNGGPCYRCLFPSPPPAGLVPDCATGGVLGVVPGLFGIIQATETIKWLTNAGETLSGRLLLMDLRSMDARTITIDSDPACPVCGDAENRLDRPLGREVSAAALQRRMANGDDIVLLDVRTREEHAQSNLGGIHIPLAELTDRIEELSAYQSFPIIAYCASGVRSEQAMMILSNNGYSGALSLAGGLRAWKTESARSD